MSDKIIFTPELTKATIERAGIEMALERSPSGGNSKPFRWHWTAESSLEIEHLTEYAIHYLNRENHASLLALGCLLESVRIAAEFQGWAAEATTNEDLSARIYFRPLPRKVEASDLFYSMVNRRTYRGPFAKSLAPNISEADDGDVRVRMASHGSVTKSFRKYIFAAEKYLWLQTKATLDFFKEVRFFDSRIAERGIRSCDLGISKMDQAMLYLFSFIPWLPSVLVRIPLLNMSFKQATSRTLKNAHFVLITAMDQQPNTLIEVGRRTMNAWVELEQQGYQLQPMSVAPLSVFDAKSGCLPEDTLRTFETLFTVTAPQLFAEQFYLKTDEKPVWALQGGAQRKA